MKICCIGFDLPEGKVKYQDELVITLDNGQRFRISVTDLGSKT